LGELHALGIDLFLHQQGLDTTTPAGKALFGMMGVFAEFERSIIQERVRAGLARVKAAGTKLGRPTIPQATEDAIRATLARGTGMIKAAKLHGVGVGTVQRISRERLASVNRRGVVPDTIGSRSARMTGMNRAYQ
jgi:DNA invertase Pin-like site-specific DNA recombinase